MLTQSEWMRETLSDLNKSELAELFKLLDEGNDCDIGNWARKHLHSAVENFHAERDGEYADSREVDARIDRTLYERAFGR